MVHTDRHRRHPAAVERAWRAWRGALAILVCLSAALASLPAAAEDGYELWLRYRPLADAAAQGQRARFAQLVAPASTPTQRAARDELLRGLGGLLGARVQSRLPAPVARRVTGGLLVVVAVLVLGRSL